MFVDTHVVAAHAAGAARGGARRPVGQAVGVAAARLVHRVLVRHARVAVAPAEYTLLEVHI